MKQGDNRTSEPFEGDRLWRSLEELTDPASAASAALREFPADNPWRGPDRADAPSRRRFLQVLGASAAMAGLVGCSDRPVEEKIVPYVRQPEQVVPGRPLIFATAMPFNGYGRGVLVESHEGRPTKIEGNPDHPASLGATDVFMQASILSLYDPDRSKTVTRAGRPSHWGAFATELTQRLEAKRQSGSRGIAILTGAVASPTMGAQIKDLRRRFPEIAWYQYEPTARVNTMAGAQAAFGRPLTTLYHLDHARIIVSLDSDFLFEDPMSLRYARHFANARRVRSDTREITRLYVAESTLSITGSMADHRLPVRPAMITQITHALAARLGVAGISKLQFSGELDRFIATAADDLKQHPGTGVVIPGEAQPPEVHALAHAINQALKNVGTTVTCVEPAEVEPTDVRQALKKLVEAMENGTIDTLLILGGNPAYTAPADIPFAQALEKFSNARVADGRLTNFTARLGSHDDETTFLCQWHVPEAHYLEAWSDVRAADGTTSIIQPLILPLYAGRSAHELLALMLKETAQSPYELVRAHWRAQRRDSGDFEQWWLDTLKKGVIDGTASAPVQVGAAKIPAPSSTPSTSVTSLDLIFRPDPCVWDGSFANNAWLQELPKPFTKLVWDNAALISPTTAHRQGLWDGDAVTLMISGKQVDAPVRVLPGLPDDVVVAHLGYGRRRGGAVATDENGVRGFDAYALWASSTPGFATGLTLQKRSRRWELVATRNHHAMSALQGVDHVAGVKPHLKPDVVVTPETSRDELELKNRRLVRVVSLPQFRSNPQAVRELGGESAKKPVLSLYPTSWDYSQGPQWGMSIDLQTCIGCNACIVACQAENNIPIVGKFEVARMREMHWLRVDSYFSGSPDRPSVYHQPVPCMHCENAPCEYVCPTGATTHSTQGLNEMTYNRCIGTRYCSNNCPYKVRRFNFFAFGYQSSKGPEQLQKNPDVTVRTRGVMEKCSYCVQRINRTRIEVEKTVLDLTEQQRTDEARQRRQAMYNDLQTACQQACPTGAIVFGDITDRQSTVATLKAQPHDYTLLDELTTRPRTSYLARVTNPNPALGEGGVA